MAIVNNSLKNLQTEKKKLFENSISTLGFTQPYQQFIIIKYIIQDPKVNNTQDILDKILLNEYS